MPKPEIVQKIQEQAGQVAKSDTAKLIATAVVTTGALVATHLVIKRIEKGADPQ